MVSVYHEICTCLLRCMDRGASVSPRLTIFPSALRDAFDDMEDVVIAQVVEEQAS